MPDILEIFKKGFDWIGDGEFLKLFLMLWAAYIGLYLAGFTFGLVIVALAENYLALIAAVIVAAIIVIALLLLISYLGSFYLYSKALEKYGEKTKYAEITFGGIVDMVKFSVVAFFTVLYNWVDKDIAKKQGILILAGVVLLILTAMGAIFNVAIIALLSFVLIVIVGLIYGLFVTYNTLRYIIDAPVRVVEAEGAKDAMVKTWPKTQGRAWEALGLWFVIVLFSFFALIAGAVITVPLSLIGELVPAVSIVTSFLDEAVSTFVNVFITFVSVFAISNYYLAVKKETTATKTVRNGGSKKKQMK